MKTKKSFKKKSKTKKHKIYKHKQTRKNNKTKKYLGSGPLDKIVTTGLSRITKKQNIIPLASTAASTFSSQSPAYRGTFAVPSTHASNSSSYTNYANDMKKTISEKIKNDINNQFRNKGKIDSLYDTINKKSTEEIQRDINKSINKIMNEYDKWSSLSVPHVEMNEYGRYPDFFKKVPESQRKPGDIEPYLNQGEEAWKGYKKSEGTKEFFRQGQYHKKLYKKEDDKKDDEDNEDNEDNDFRIEEIDDFVEKSPEAPQLIQNISMLGRSLNIKTPLPLFSHMYLFKIEQNLAFQHQFNDKLNETIQNIEDPTLKEKVVEYNNQTKEQENTGFIGWTKAAALTGYDMFSSTKDYVIQKTAEGVAIAETKIVNNAVYASRLIPLVPIILKTTGLGLFDKGLYQSVSAIIAMSSESLDWSKTENLDQYNKKLTIILDIVLPLLLKDLTKQGCNESIPQILKHVINPTTVNKITSSIQKETKTNEKFSQLVDNSNDFCNKIIPIISEQFKKNGFSKGIGIQANNLLNNYLDTSLSLAKDIVWDIFKKTTFTNIRKINSNIDSELESGNTPDSDTLSEQESQKIKEKYNDLFQKISINVVIDELEKKAEESYKFLSSTINPSFIKQQVKEINDKPVPPVIQQEEENIKENLVNFAEDKVKIGDFITNLFPSIEKLLLLWDKEIYKQSGKSGFSYTVCLLNVLDLRINTLLDETCKIYAKGLLSQTACSDHFIDFVGNFYTKPATDITIDDVKESLKSIVINLIIKNIKDKKISVNIDDEEFIYESFTYQYFMFDKAIVDES
jgi:hypothetical protein